MNPRREASERVSDAYENEEHFPGASLTIDTLAAAPDQRASALIFLRRGRELLRGP